MTAPAPDPSLVDDALRRLHRSAIVSLALCATGIGITAFAGPETSPDADSRTHSLVALALAGVAILARRSGPLRARSFRWFVYGALVSMLAAVGLGLLGVLIALREDQSQVGLLYTLAGALLVLRPPPSLSEAKPAGS